jgi:hypothetical protein
MILYSSSRLRSSLEIAERITCYSPFVWPLAEIHVTIVVPANKLKTSVIQSKLSAMCWEIELIGIETRLRKPSAVPCKKNHEPLGSRENKSSKAKFEVRNLTQSSHVKIRSDLLHKITQGRYLDYCRCQTGTESLLGTWQSNILS